METTPTPFDLNRAVQQWRDNLEQSPAFRRDNLEELETHLRDSVAYLQQRGLAADEAFLIATRRVGTDAALGTEFGKTNTHGVWVDRGLGMLAGIQIYGCIGQLMSTATSGIMLGVSEIKPLEPTTLSYLWGGLVCGLAHLLIFAAVLTGSWRLLQRKSGWISGQLQRKRSFAKVVVSCLLIILCVRMVSLGGQLLYMKMARSIHHDYNNFWMAGNYGVICAALLESTVLLILAFSLARRKYFARA